VIGSRIDAMAGARAAAIERGYRAIVMPDAVTGEARDAGPAWLDRVRHAIGPSPRPVCVISSGETTVRVTGAGRGGRNLEFALSIAESMASVPRAAMASIGTDGIDGSSGVAGGIVDTTTMARAAEAGLAPPGSFLAANDSVAFFAPLGDVVRLGRTDTNVGDLQVLLID
jgi:glycerate 2-kinase